MISLRAILAEEAPVAAITGAQSIPTVALIVGGVLLAIAFIMGFVKGFRKVSWNGAAWVAGTAAYVLVSKIVPAGAFWLPLLLAVISAGGSFALFKLLAYFLRPKMRWIKDDINADTSLAEYGLEFEPEYLEYDGEHDYAPYGKRIYKTGYGAPSLFFRLLGGLSCALNVATVLVALCSLFLLVVDVSVLKTYPIGGIFEHPAVAWAFPYVKQYALDFIMIGIMMLLAKEGYNRGIVYSLRSIVITLATLAAIGGSFYLPFSPFGASVGALSSLIATCTKVFVNLGVLSELLGKLLAGFILLMLCAVILIILNVLLKSLCRTILDIKFTREVDSWVAAAVYLAIGAMVCVGIWFVLGSIDAMGIFPFGAMLSEGTLSKAIYDFVMGIVGPFFAKL